MEKYFKPLIPFSDNKGVYNVGGTYKAQAVRVVNWVEAGLCEDDGDVDEEKEVVKDPKTGAADPAGAASHDKEPENDPQEPAEGEKSAEDAKALEDMKEEASEPENLESGDEYDNMSYPDLKKAGKLAKIKGYHTMKADALKAALRKADKK